MPRFARPFNIADAACTNIRMTLIAAHVCPIMPAALTLGDAADGLITRRSLPSGNPSIAIASSGLAASACTLASEVISTKSQFVFQRCQHLRTPRRSHRCPPPPLARADLIVSCAAFQLSRHLLAHSHNPRPVDVVFYFYLRQFIPGPEHDGSRSLAGQVAQISSAVKHRIGASQRVSASAI